MGTNWGGKQWKENGKGEKGKEWRRERLGEEKGWGGKTVRERKSGEGKSRGREGGEGLCSSKNSFKKPW